MDSSNIAANPGKTLSLSWQRALLAVRKLAVRAALAHTG